MDEIDRLVEEKVKEKEAYAKAKAEAEVKEESLIMQDPIKTVQTKLNVKVAEHIDNSKVVNEKVGETADKLVDNGLQVQKNKAAASVIDSEDEIIEADYKKNKEEYLYHGIDHKIDKEWKRKVLLVINNIWFVIFAIVSCFTLVPVSTFLSRVNALKGIVKGVAIVVGIILLIICLSGITYLIVSFCGNMIHEF